MSIEVAQAIVASTPLLRAVERVEFLNKGYSTDSKYVLWQNGEPRFLLRLAEAGLYERRKSDFEMMRLHHERGIGCSEPFLVGVTGDGETCYTLLSYLKGENAEDALPGLTEPQQHEIGFVAGQELLKLHEICHPDPAAYGWPARRAAKYRKNVEAARELGLTFPGQAQAEGFVEANLGLMNSAPVRFQHDDYHTANLIVDGGEFVGVIDFNRFDWGDPVEDFYKLAWFSVPVSVQFARGQVQGYMSCGEPENFWRRYNLYVAMSLHGSLVWVVHYYPKQLGLFQQRIAEIQATHDFVDADPPSWYAE
ncbi:MAG: phosphotransferase [Chloroflexi bacterium]|nr:phosphotransferase [Chloroflexota bacterium]